VDADDGAPLLQSFSSLRDAQMDGEEEDALLTDDDEETAPQRSAAAAGAAAAPSASVTGGAPSRDCEADVGDVAASECSESSTGSLLCHPAHKHAQDEAQCILAHDWYTHPNDQPTWLVLVKWKRKPVAGRDTQQQWGGQQRARMVAQRRYLPHPSSHHSISARAVCVFGCV